MSITQNQKVKWVESRLITLETGKLGYRPVTEHGVVISLISENRAIVRPDRTIYCKDLACGERFYDKMLNIDDLELC